jgi:hypothetical protein
MRWTDVDLRPSRSKLRQFGGLCVAVFGALALWRWLAHDQTFAATVLALVAATCGVLGLLAPRLLWPMFVGLSIVAFPIGWLVSRAILLLLFGVMITPAALIFRGRGRDALALRRNRNTQSYWEAKSSPRDVGGYFRQY